MKPSEREKLVALLAECSAVFRTSSKKARLLGTLSWGPEVVDAFFRSNAEKLPKPYYPVDVDSLKEVKASLAALAPKLKGNHPVLQWLERARMSFTLGLDLLLNLETPAFYEISSQIYGNSKSALFGGGTSQLDLAHAISSRISVCSLNDIEESFVEKNSQSFAESIERKIEKRNPKLNVKVEVTDQIVAKVVAGQNRVRIRKDARFSKLELRALWNHEIESHCLTAQNGDLQESCPFLAGGGPRTTRTQEGLAVFYELYGHTLSQRRFISLCNRVEAVNLAEEGAGFIDVYRWYLVRTDTPMEAFYNAQRIFRGAMVAGKYPFTKDVVYLAGLLEVYHFLQMATKHQNRLLVESLIAGRIALEDAGTIAWLRTHGILSPPHFVPDWLKNWEALVSFFSFTAVLGTVDLSGFPAYLEENPAFETWDF